MASVHLSPLRQTSGGSSSTSPAAGSQPEVIEVDDNKSVLAITPALVYDMEGEVYVLPADIVQAGDDLKMPDGYRREGSGERSFMYLLGVYVVPLAEEDHERIQVLLHAGPRVTQKQDDRSLKRATAAT